MSNVDTTNDRQFQIPCPLGYEITDVLLDLTDIHHVIPGYVLTLSGFTFQYYKNLESRECTCFVNCPINKRSQRHVSSASSVISVIINFKILPTPCSEH